MGWGEKEKKTEKETNEEEIIKYLPATEAEFHSREWDLIYGQETAGKLTKNFPNKTVSIRQKYNM